MGREIVLALLDMADPSAAVFEDGRLVAHAEEERFTRDKHAFEAFPVRSTRYVLEEVPTTLAEVDRVAYGWDCTKYPVRMAEHFLDLWHEYDKGEQTLEWEKDQLRTLQPEVVEAEIRSELAELPGSVPDIAFVDHHEAHARSAFHYSGFDSGAVLTADAYGEDTTMTGWHAEEEAFERVFSVDFPNSLGLYMYAITTFLGFRANNGEGKVMGLAAYGDPDPVVRAVLERVLSVTERGFQLDPTYVYYGGHDHHERFTDKLVSELGEPREHGDEITQFHENVAFEGQRLLEEALLSSSERLLDETGAERLCLAGGVVLNCKANMRLREELDLEGLFVQPVAGDNGVPMGAGLLASDAEPPARESRMDPPYLGWKPTPERVRAAIDAHDVEPVVSGREAVRDRMVSKLADGGVVARYVGRMESGPRALGNRSILADPSDAGNLVAVNEVKRRETWRPFAPTILAEYAGELLVGDEPFDPYMIQTYEVRTEREGDVEATVHVDGTTRPQVVSKGANETYWKLVDRFRERTSVPAVLNTSFNLSGDPIVRTPEEAITTFLESPIDLLQVGEHLVTEQ